MLKILGTKTRFRHHEEAIKSNNNQFSSVTKSCRTLCDLMDCSTPDFLVHHQPGVYWNGGPLNRWCYPTISSSAIPFSSRLQSFPASGSFPMGQFFASGGQSFGVCFNINPSSEHSGLISFRMDWLDILAVQDTSKSLLQHHSSKASIRQCSAFFTVQL